MGEIKRVNPVFCFVLFFFVFSFAVVFFFLINCCETIVLT